MTPDDLTPSAAMALIADHRPANLSVLNELLRPHYRVLLGNTDARVLLAARSPRPPDLILLDVIMPDIDGYTALSNLLKDPATRDIRVIFMTAKDDAGDEERGLTLGAVDDIPKPIKPAVVLARNRSQIELKRARDRLGLHRSPAAQTEQGSAQ